MGNNKYKVKFSDGSGFFETVVYADTEGGAFKRAKEKAVKQGIILPEDMWTNITMISKAGMRTTLQVVIEKFNLMSDKDFKEWFLNNMEELERSEMEMITEAYWHERKRGQFDTKYGFYIKKYSKP
jgi:hypothetical protein